MVKLLEENIGKNLYDVGLGSDFLHMSPKTEETKVKINKQGYIKLKLFCTVNQAINKTKRLPNEWKKIFANDISDNGLISKIYKELIYLKIKEEKKKQPY